MTMTGVTGHEEFFLGQGCVEVPGSTKKAKTSNHTVDFFLLQCDDIDLPISSTTMVQLCSLFPLLSHLLFHQNKKYLYKDGMKVVPIPHYLKVTRNDILLLLDVVMWHKTPKSEDEKNELLETCHKLGGGPTSLLQKYCCGLPACPEEDYDNLYLWRKEPASNGDAYVELQEDGWQVVGFVAAPQASEESGYYAHRDDDDDKKKDLGMVLLRKERAAVKTLNGNGDNKPRCPKDDVDGKFSWRWVSVGHGNKCAQLQDEEGWQLVCVQPVCAVMQEDGGDDPHNYSHAEETDVALLRRPKGFHRLAPAYEPPRQNNPADDEDNNNNDNDDDILNNDDDEENDQVAPAAV